MIALSPVNPDEAGSPIMQKLAITYQSPGILCDNPRNARQHPEVQIDRLCQSIARFGFLAPVLVDGENLILAGHARVAAARKLRLDEIPTVCADHLSEARQRAFMLADNKIASLATYDEVMLAEEFEYLLEVDEGIEITDTGFAIGEIDALIEARHKPETREDEVSFDPARLEQVCRPGDLWLMGQHRLFCGDALDPISYDMVLGEELADQVFTDPPFNLSIPGVVSGQGKVRHDNFAMASGEMSRQEFASFLGMALGNARRFSRDGSLHFVFMDWRQIEVLLEVGRSVYDELKTICVWNKIGGGGMGGLYRSAHELIAVFKHGKAAHCNNIRLGAHGRNRSNVWSYPGLSIFGRGRAEKLSWHPTVKPLDLVADALLDCSNPGDLVLDPFAGSGTCALAAQRCHRRSALIEFDPRYCDRILRRFCDATGIEPVNAWTGDVVRRLGKPERSAGFPNHG
jgi:DNA modification methylase